MASMTEDRIEVGTCDLGNVFIFHRASQGDYSGIANETWMVRAGNHTVGTYDTEAGANAVARALCGIENLTNEFIADEPAEPVKVRRK